LKNFSGVIPRNPNKKGREDMRKERRGGERRERTEGRGDSEREGIKEGGEGREWCPLASS
jgi:hypothetical protein